jgi:hypothetical protein
MAIQRLPLWVYGAITLVLVLVLGLSYARFDTVSRIELAIPAAFWTIAFAIIAWRRVRHR